jgi:hypothetical protein
MDTLTFVHVVLSLIGIASGLIVLFGLLGNQRLDTWTAIFLITTVATSVTGFMFPFTKLLPSHVVGIISLVVLAIALYARYPAHLSGRWSGIYAATATAALYLNVFVLVAQLFMKVPALAAMAPTQSESPFVIAQSAVLVVFAVLGGLSAVRFRATV